MLGLGGFVVVGRESDLILRVPAHRENVVQRGLLLVMLNLFADYLIRGPIFLIFHKQQAFVPLIIFKLLLSNCELSHYLLHKLDEVPISFQLLLLLLLVNY